MTRFIAVLVAAIAYACLGLAAEAWGQGRTCAPHDAMVAMLTGGQWRETPQVMGLAGAPGAPGRQIMEIFANRATGTWTIIVTAPDGVACLVASGDMWGPVPQVPTGAPA